MQFFPGVTIDAPHSRDLDDAIWVERADEGWKVIVSVANVADSVPKNSELDSNAFGIGFSRYSGKSVRQSMLPSSMSEQSLSLLPGKDSAVLAVEIALSPNLETVDVTVSEGRLYNIARLSHVEAVEKAAEDSGIGETLRQAWELASGLLARRRRRGALAFFSESAGVITDEDGNPLRMEGGGADVARAYIIVQEMMILANAALAEYSVRNRMQVLYRNHEGNPSADRQALLRDMERLSAGEDASSVTEARLGMMIGRAVLGDRATGHYGLNLPVYAWFTSPIRRYADLINQRVLLAHVRRENSPYVKGELEAAARHLNDLTAQADEEASAWYKMRSRVNAQKLSGSRDLSRIVAADMTAMIKNSFEFRSFGDNLIAEIEARLEANALTAKDCARLALAEGHGAEKARRALFDQIAKTPFLATSIITHLTQIGNMKEPDWREGVEADMFVCAAVAGPNAAEGRGRTKKEARQMAAAGLLASVAGEEWQAPTLENSIAHANKARAQDNLNAKGDLIAICQKHKIEHPVFSVTHQGPSHSPTFTAHARVNVSGEKMSSGPHSAASRKDAERAASEALLKQITEWERLPKDSGQRKIVAGNPKGELQEICQKRKFPLPAYSVAEIREGTAPLFECVAVVIIDGHERTSSAHRAGSKKEAEARAAAELLALF